MKSLAKIIFLMLVCLLCGTEFLKKTAEQDTAFLAENPFAGDDTVIEAFIERKVVDRTGRPDARVATTENQARDARQNGRPHTHHTRFEGDIKGAIQ